jgi:hypothetical protein
MSDMQFDAETERTVAGMLRADDQGDDEAMSELINAHILHLEHEQRSRTTIYHRRRVLSLAHRELPIVAGSQSKGLDDVYTADIQVWLANPDWARWTPHTYYGHLVGFYRWAYAEGRSRSPPPNSPPRCAPPANPG